MRFVRAVLAVVAAIALAGTSSLSASAWAPGDTVTVEDGALRGKVTGNGRQFLGIPYAAPPTGENRFRAPRPPAAWAGTRDATKAGSICPQIGIGNEDCLSLNVYTPPAAASKDLPVMVWIPGGAYAVGWASGYDPTPMVAKGDVIVVTVNYRLGPLGFVSLPGLTEESGTSGNYGLLDQQAALRWVRDNIGVFGGNAGNVTLFGESAGGSSVCMQMISPGAAGLFHKAISQSGACTALGPLTKEEAYGVGRKFAESVGCDDPAKAVACLRAKKPGDFAVDLLKIFGPNPLEWVPVIDGTVVPEHPVTALKAGRYNKVPFMAGSNKNEAKLFTALNYHLTQLRRANAEDLEKETRFRAGDRAEAALAAYPPASSANADEALSAMSTAAVFSCPAQAINEAAAVNPGQKVYAYEFADPEPPLSDIDPMMPLGAYHVSDVWYLFKNVNSIPLILGLDQEQQRLSDQMIGYWTGFAKTGDPNNSAAPAWPAFPQVQRLSSEGTGPFSTFATDHKCEIWND